MRLKKIIIILVISLGLSSSAHALIFINEILADPASSMEGDANNDGITSYKDDEFIEIFNKGTVAIDISGWSLTDKTKTRHIFAGNTIIAAQDYFVVFGGGRPVMNFSSWQTASSGSLGLNNGGDVITLLDKDKKVVDQLIYGNNGGKDQSLTYYPVGQGRLRLHSDIPQAKGRLFSPGTDVDGHRNASTLITPEPSTIIYMLGGLCFLLRKRAWG